MTENDMTEILGVPLLPWQLAALIALVDSAGGTLEVPRRYLEAIEPNDGVSWVPRLDGGFTLHLFPRRLK